MTARRNGKRKINVVHLRSSRGTGGGPDKTLLFSALEGDREAFNVHVVYLKSENDPDFDLEQRANKLGVESFTAIGERSRFDLRAMRVLLRVLREKNADILSCHCYKSDLYGLILSRFHSMKLLTTVHGPIPERAHQWSRSHWKVRYLYDQLDYRLLRYFDHVIIVAETMRKAIVRYGVEPQRITCVRNAIDADYFCKAEGGDLRQRFGIPTDATVIGAVGRLDQQKDYPNLMAATRILLDEGHNVFCVVAGLGPQEQELRERVQALGLGQRFLFLGHFQDVREVFQMMDIYALSSITEGLPNTVLEAMAMEVPVVSTQVDGVAEVVAHEREALLVPSRDSTQLAAAIRRLLVDPFFAQQLSRAARSRIERDFSFSTRMRRVEGIYRDLLEVRSVPHKQQVADLSEAQSQSSLS
ncbi:MAG TPA: glycosyltransferase family 4 protein [Pirellulales bacterium]|nr:glycosyltransferase family 4 protein [Pirellulales bacterium]